MSRRQIAFTVTAVVLALVLGAGVALLASSGGDDDTAQRPSASTSTTSSTAPSSSTTTTLAPRPGVTVPTLPPPTVVVIPPTSTTPPTKAPKPKKPRRPRKQQTTTTPPPTVGPQVVPETPPSEPPTAPPTAPPTEPPTTSTTTTSTTTSTTTTSTTTTTVPAATDPGVGERELRLAVVADDEATFQGARAWAASVNRRGGRAGRVVELDVLPTDDTAAGYDAAVVAACDDTFAMVATSSLHDENQEVLACGIPDVAVEASPSHAHNTRTYPAFPRVMGISSVGPYRWLQADVDGCCAQFVVVPSEGRDRAPTQVDIDAAERIGFTTAATPFVDPDASSIDYDALAQELASSDATFVSSGLGAESLLELRRAATATGVIDVPTWYCDARCYFPTFATEDDADGVYVAIETVPFGDRRDVPALRTYLRETVRAGDTPTDAGLRAYVAGLLFEEALDAVVAEHGDEGLTRARLLDALADIDDFTADGLIGPTDVGARTSSGCFVLLQVDDGRFTRVAPAERGSLDCSSENLISLDD